MSLETVIQENTDTMKKLIAAWNSLANNAKSIKAEADTGVPVTVKAGGVPVATVSKEVEAPKPAAIQAAPVTATPAPTEVAVAAPAAASPSEVAYEDVAKAITATVKVDRARVVAALAKFGAAKGTELKAEQYAAFLEELA